MERGNVVGQQSFFAYQGEYVASRRTEMPECALRILFAAQLALRSRIAAVSNLTIAWLSVAVDCRRRSFLISAHLDVSHLSHDAIDGRDRLCWTNRSGCRTGR
jgi:hypothetical protein